MNKTNGEEFELSSKRIAPVFNIGVDKLATLIRYLYMDEKHAIVVNNGLADLEIRMTGEMYLTCKNLNFPEFDATGYDMPLGDMLIAVSQLEEQPAVEYPGKFKSRWEEIEFIVGISRTLKKS